MFLTMFLSHLRSDTRKSSSGNLNKNLTEKYINIRLLEQRKSDDIGECFKVDAKRLDTKNQDETVLSSASTYYSTVSHDSGECTFQNTS